MAALPLSFDKTIVTFDSTDYTWDATVMGSAADLYPQAGALVISGHRPVAWSTNHKEVSPSTGSLIISTYRPTVTYLNKIVVTGTGSITIRGFAPTITGTISNNCKSDSVKLERLIRTSQNETIDLYSLFSSILSSYIETAENCCIDKNALFQMMIDRLDIYINQDNIIKETITSITTRIVEKIILCCPSVQIDYGVAFYNEVCAKDVDTNFESTFEASFQEHTCAFTDGPLPDYTYEITFDNFTCAYGDSDLFDSGFEVEFTGHVCSMKDESTLRSTFTVEFTGHICEYSDACGQYSAILCNTSTGECVLTADAQWTGYQCRIEIV